MTTNRHQCHRWWKTTPRAILPVIMMCGLSPAFSQDVTLFTHTPSDDPARAALRVDMATRSPHRVNPLLYGKFTEHLGRNIYNGIDAQILTNPTFEKWYFSAGTSAIDGGIRVESNIETISARLREQGGQSGIPDSGAWLDSYKAGAAWGWVRLGGADQVLMSPDVGPAGGRAQRLEISNHGRGQPPGIFQWTHLPLQRTRKFQFRIVARATAAVAVRLSLAAVNPDGSTGLPLASADVSLSDAWSTSTGVIEIPASQSLPAEGLFAFSVTSPAAANLVLDRVLLYPADHVNQTDPDIVRLLKAAGLPLMRWPGGNFVSGYHWRDGVGPVDQRPTRLNPAWGGLEYNLFGTDEFVALCRAIGCLPMICINAGDGTPEEAAAWVQYCNGSQDTPMGRLRAANGHPEPYGIRYWEVGNEIYGRWQISWTTPEGYLDRYLRFHRAMKAADPSIVLPGCGKPDYQDNRWNERLISGAGPRLQMITDHILTGGPVNSGTDGHELFHAFLGFARQLGKEYRDLRRQMTAAGIEKPRLAITELQLFARFGNRPENTRENGRLSPDTMPTPKTISEALYDATIIHECIRMGDFVEMLTHSATVNHGGGLDKRDERVWASPSYYGHALGKALFGAIPVGVDLTCGTYSTRHTFGRIAPMRDVPLLDAMAVLNPDETTLTLMLVHRGSEAGPIALTIDPGAFPAAPGAAVVTLAGETMFARNTLEDPEHIRPKPSDLRLEAGRGRLILAPYSLTRITLERRGTAQH